MKVKPYCECEDSKLYLGSLNTMPKDKFDERIVKVHYSSTLTPFDKLCCRPTYGVWQEFICPCIECGKLFSSPWEIRCKSCHDEVLGTPYRGWSMARKGSIDNYNFYLTANRERATLTEAVIQPAFKLSMS